MKIGETQETESLELSGHVDGSGGTVQGDSTDSGFGQNWMESD